MQIQCKKQIAAYCHEIEWINYCYIFTSWFPISKKKCAFSFLRLIFFYNGFLIKLSVTLWSPSLHCTNMIKVPNFWLLKFSLLTSYPQATTTTTRGNFGGYGNALYLDNRLIYTALCTCHAYNKLVHFTLERKNMGKNKPFKSKYM